MPTWSATRPRPTSRWPPPSRGPTRTRPRATCSLPSWAPPGAVAASGHLPGRQRPAADEGPWRRDRRGRQRLRHGRDLGHRFSHHGRLAARPGGPQRRLRHQARRERLDPLVYTTYLGGSDDDAAAGIAVDAAGKRLPDRPDPLRQLPGQAPRPPGGQGHPARHQHGVRQQARRRRHGPHLFDLPGRHR